MNTIRIYETDSHARRLQARVLSCEESENGWLVELDRTIFYPTGGGQPCDTGTLGGADVTETLLRGETVLHRCTAALPVDTLFAAHPALTLTPAQEKCCRNGASFTLRFAPGRYRLYAESGEFLALGEVRDGRMETVKSFFAI